MTPSLKFVIKKRQIAFRKDGKSSQVNKFWRGKVQGDVKTARSKYYSNSVAKLKDTNPSRWWKKSSHWVDCLLEIVGTNYYFPMKCLRVWSWWSLIITFLLVSLRIFNR